MQNPPYVPDPPGRIELNLAFNPMQFFLNATTPRVWVNGHALAAHWGRQSFDMPAGPHDVFVAFPYLFTDKAGSARLTVPVYSSHVTVVNYQTPGLMFMNGTMHVLSTVPMTMHRPW